MQTSRKVALPPLIFGNDRALLHTCAKSFGDMVDAVAPGVNAYEPMAEADGVFRSKSVYLQLDGLTLINASVSPTLVDRRDNQSLVLLLPVSGDPVCSVKVGRDLVHWGAAQGGCLLPITDERVVGTGGFRNQLMIQIDPIKLEKHASAMLGACSVPPDLMLKHVRPLPLYFGQTSLLKGLFQTMPLLHSYFDQPHLLNTLGIGDVLMRQLAIWLRPDLFLHHPLRPSESAASTKKQLVRLLCEYMVAHMAEPLTLADLESVCGLSARTIQYAFQQEQGCSPLAWLREQRLMAAQQLLLNQSELGINQVALACGFPNASLFAASYRKRFGITPTESRR